MENFLKQSMLEMLPDEILLEICKYLSCVEILQSFVGLNSRMTRTITQYRHYVSLHKASISQFSYLSINVLPQIGFHIRSLLIDCCYSVLQFNLFSKYFGKNMSTMFPHLEKISLVAFEHDQLVTFLDTLHDLNHLTTIHLYTLFTIPRDQEPTIFRKLLEANNKQLTSVLIDDQSSFLSFNDTSCYLNILHLCIKIRAVTELGSLFALVPNLHYLNVTIQNDDFVVENFDKMRTSPLLHLTDFQLNSIERKWKLEELLILFGELPIVQRLSLFLFTRDLRLVEGNTLLPLLPSTVQHFNYVVYYFHGTQFHRNDEIVSSWPPSHPITCFFSDTVLFIHTLPWYFARIELSSSVGKMMASDTNSTAGYDRRGEQLVININRNFTLTKSLRVIPQYRQIRELVIRSYESGELVKEQQASVSCLPKLPRLIQIRFHGSITIDFDHLSFVFIAAPKLFRLDLPFDCLMRLLDNQEICDLLRQRIKSLSIDRATHSSQITFSKEHVPIIASIFTRLRDLYVDLTHLSTSTVTALDEDVLRNSMVRNLHLTSSQQKDETIMPLSMDSMTLYLLREFKEHELMALCVDGQPSENMKTDAKQWLQDNTFLCEKQFEATFNVELSRLLVWM